MKRGPPVPPGVRRGPVGSRRASRRPVRTLEGPVWVRTSIVHRYGTVERSVKPCRVLSCQIRVQMETRRNTIWLDRTRRALADHSTVPYQCTTDIRTGRYGTMTYPAGTQQDPTQPMKPDP